MRSNALSPTRKVMKKSRPSTLEKTSNFERMIHLADEFFDVKSDPAQISVNEQVMIALRKIHPSTMTEKRTSKGPIAWGLVIPTTYAVMQRFVSKEITERQLLRLTHAGQTFVSIYLCSALVLPEFRRRGYAERLLCNAVNEIRKDHPIECLYYWSFSAVGTKLAKAIGTKFGLPLYRRKS